MKSIAVVMVTIDRTPMANYLGQTLDNLKRSGVFESPYLHSFTLCNSKPDNFAYDAVAALGFDFLKVAQGEVLTANWNVVSALLAGADSGAPWVLFLEDDIDVCDDFLGSVGRWLETEPHLDRYRVFPFGAAYDVVGSLHERGKTSWPYPVCDFYGTQAFAVRAVDAASIAEAIVRRIGDTKMSGAYDIIMHGWAEQLGDKYFLASVPSFVQHVGSSSIINPRPNVHTFKSWPGRDWSYA